MTHYLAQGEFKFSKLISIFDTSWTYFQMIKDLYTVLIISKPIQKFWEWLVKYDGVSVGGMVFKNIMTRWIECCSNSTYTTVIF